MIADMPVVELPEGTQLCPDSSGSYRYRIERVLGSGGFGITYRATDRRLAGNVVIKELAFEGAAYRDTETGTLETLQGKESLQDKLVDRFLREARLLNSIRNPHVVRVTDVWEERGTAYYAMDEVHASRQLPSEPLRHADGRLNWDQIETWSLQLLDALHAVHAEGLIHGDIKPQNALVDRANDLVLIDFGTARSEEEMTRTATSMA